MTTSVFVSLFAYSAAKVAGDLWSEAQERFLAEPPPEWPGFQTLKNARETIEQGVQMIDGGTLIAKARSRAAGEFLRSSCAVWLQIDDDVEADREVCARVIQRAVDLKGIVGAPYVLRDGCALSYELSSPTEILSADRVVGDVYPVRGLGMGLTAVARDVVAELAPTVPMVTVGDKGIPYPALFIEAVEHGTWIGEDVAFCHRAVSAGFPVAMLLDAPIVHAGRICKVDRTSTVWVGDEPTREALTRRDLAVK